MPPPRPRPGFARGRPTALALACALLWLGAPAATDPWGWPEARPDEVGVDGARLEALTRHLRESPDLNVHSVLLVVRGQLVYEAYFEGEDQDWGRSLGHVVFDASTLHDLRSVSKSVTSALVGVAFRKGLLTDLDARVVDLLGGGVEGVSPAARELTLRHLLTMSAGLEWDETLPYTDPENSEIAMIRSEDPVAFVLAQPGTDPPGEVFEYSGGLTTLLAAVLERVSGRPLAEFARSELFDPLGIQDFVWHAHDPSGLAMAASGLRMRPRDVATFAQLYLDDGVWNGERLLPPGWAELSFERAFAAPFVGGYGFQWWKQRYTLDGREMDLPVAIGNGGQRVILAPELDLAAVVMAGNYSDGSLRSVRLQALGERLFADHLLPAVGVGRVSREWAWPFWLQAVALLGALWAAHATWYWTRRLYRRRVALREGPAG